MHLRDIRDGKQVPLGKGELDFATLAANIRKAGWPGWLTVEEEALKTEDTQAVEAVLESDRQMIRTRLGA